MGLSCLSNQPAPIVADTTTVINFNATGCASTILRAIPNQFIITDVVLDELREDVRSGRNDAQLVTQLITDGLIKVVTIDSLQNNDFERLVSGSAATTLDDGEAATIAYAEEHGITALIDERKANRICQTQYANLLVGSTVDVLCLDCVETAIGGSVLADAAFNALQGARMRVLSHHLDWMTALIGQERAALCDSLPRNIRTALSITHTE